jgi:hypothetical protein
MALNTKFVRLSTLNLMSSGIVGRWLWDSGTAGFYDGISELGISLSNRFIVFTPNISRQYLRYSPPRSEGFSNQIRHVRRNIDVEYKPDGYQFRRGGSAGCKSSGRPSIVQYPGFLMSPQHTCEVRRARRLQ